MNELENIQNLIHVIRGQRVMLDRDLAKAYGVETKVLNQAVKRNIKRFEGEDYMFQLTKSEWQELKVQLLKTYHVDNEDAANLRSQFVTANSVNMQRYLPFAFTEIGVAMLSSVLKTEVAILANRRIMKAFVAYRHLAEMPIAATYIELRKQIDDIRQEMNDILADQNDINESTRAQLDAISTVLAELQANPSTPKPRRRIGFIQSENDDG